MKDKSAKDESAFDHAPFQAGKRTLIKSTCKRCGMSKVVSTIDDTLANGRTATTAARLTQCAFRTMGAALPAIGAVVT